MDIVDELERLSDLHRDGQLTDDEFDAAKAALLAEQARGTPPATAANVDAVSPTDPAAASIRQGLDELRRQQARLQLDQDWERARDAHMVAHGEVNNPYRVVPTRAGGVWIAIVGLVGGIAFLVSTGSMMRGWSGGPMGTMRRSLPERVTIFDDEGRAIGSADRADIGVPYGGGAPGDGLWGAFPLFGLLFAAFAVWAGVSHYRRAVAYEAAEQAYRSRRAQLDDGAPGGDGA